MTLIVVLGIAWQSHSQDVRDSTKISSVDLDSLYSKALRGFAAIQDNKDKSKALKFCDSAKVIQATQIVNLKEIKVTYESTIGILKQDKKDLLLAVKMANQQVKIEHKIGRKKWGKGFTWGAVLGVLGSLAGVFFIK